MPHLPTPGMNVTDYPRYQMAGKGAPRPTLFGVLGKTKYDSHIGAKTLGGLVANTKASASIPSGNLGKKPSSMKTEHNIASHKDATAIPGAHYAQVPYAGAFMKHVGAKC